jgi:hypothetical protein
MDFTSMEGGAKSSDKHLQRDLRADNFASAGLIRSCVSNFTKRGSRPGHKLHSYALAIERIQRVISVNCAGVDGDLRCGAGRRCSLHITEEDLSAGTPASRSL